MSAISSAFTRWSGAPRASGADEMVPNLWSRVRAVVGTFFLAAILAVGMPTKLAHAQTLSEVTLAGPRTAEATPFRGRTAFFADIDLYSRSRSQAGPYRLVIDNASSALVQGKSTQIEIWHNMQRVASSSDFFDAAGNPVAKISKTLNVRPFLNLVIVKVAANSPVKFTWRVVAGDSAPPAPAQLTGIAPSGLTLTNGSAGVFNLSLAPAPSAAGQIGLSSSVPGVATVATSVPFAAGQTTVAVPVQAVGVGASVVRAQLGSSSVSANVQVNPALPRLANLLPAQAQLQEGARGDFSVSISPVQLQAVTIQLASSDPAKVSVPASVSVPAGQTSASFQGQALAAGNAQITATIQGASGGTGSSAYSQVQVVPLPPTAVSLLPSTNALNKGSSVNMTVAISAAQSTPTTVALSVAQSAVAGVPAQVVVPAGATQASFPLQALAVGNTLVSASLNGSTVQAAVQVNPVPVAIASLAPATATVTQGAQTELLLTLNGAQTSATTIQLASSPAGVVQLPGTLVIPAGQTEGRIAVTALAVGQADVVATLGGVSRSSAITVTPQPAAIDTLLPNPLGIQQDASGNLTVRLKSSQAQPQVINITTSDAAKLRVPASVSIPAGQIEQSFTVQALAVGQATVSVSVNGTSAQTSVQIAAPPPQIASLLPTTQDLPKGKLGKLKLTLDRAPLDPATVPLSNSSATTLGVPANVTVPAGQLAIDIPVTALAQGTATVGASLNGSNAQGEVRVVEAEVTGIVLSPSPVGVSAGQSTQIKATATYSDGSERIVTTGAGTAWSVIDPTVATISAEGRLTGVKPGTTQVQALQSVLPTYGNPNPSPVVGQADVTITEGSPLALSTSKTSLLTGESVVVSITSPYAAGATPFTVNLEASGNSGGGGLEFPASASILPGLTSVNVTVKAIRAGSVTLSASAPQFPAGQLGFTVTDPVVSQVQVSAVAPTSAKPGAQITLTGSGFLSPASANTVSFFGGAPGVVVSGSATQLVVTVAPQAQTGAITVTNANGSGASPVFTVMREQDFGFTASPAALRLMQGSNAAAALQLQSTGTQAYEGLAKLSVSGLPTGVTASFDPPQLSAVQTGRLLLQAATDAPLGNATLTVRSEATIGGLPWVRTSTLSVEVVSKANVTAVKGRFVTPSGTPVPGVIVRQDTSTNQVTSDAAGNFFLEGLLAGTTTLRFDATPANPLYPIWPMNVVLQAGELRTYPDWIINPPPIDAKFKPIANATTEQRITDERFPGFEVVLPAGATITGWDGVVKTRIAVEKVLPDQLPVEQPPFVMKEAYQLYFGTPMGGIPSQPIPVTLPNVAERDPGDQVEIWWFDGSPMGGSGEWKLAGLGTVSADGKSVSSNAGVGLPRFCGVCGLVSLSCDEPPFPPEPPPVCPEPTAGNPVDLFTGQEMPRTTGMGCAGTTPIEVGWKFNPVDSFQNRAYTRGSFGLGWTNAYDVVFLPFSGDQKRMVMPGGRRVNFTGSAGNLTTNHPLFAGALARQLASDSGSAGSSQPTGVLSFSTSSRSASSVSYGGSGGSSSGGSVSISLNSRIAVDSGTTWEVIFKDGTRWIFEPYSGLSTISPGTRERGGTPSWLTRVIDANGNATKISRNQTGKITRIEGAAGRRFDMTLDASEHVSRITDHTGRQTNLTYTDDHRIASITDPRGLTTSYSYHLLPLYTGPGYISARDYGDATWTSSSSSGSNGSSSGGSSGSSVSVPPPPIACYEFIPWRKTQPASQLVSPPPRKYPLYQGLKEVRYPWSSQSTVNTYSTDRILQQVTSTGETRRFSYRRTGACVAKINPGEQPMDLGAEFPAVSALVPKQVPFTCQAGKPYVYKTAAGEERGMCPDVESMESHSAGWRFYGGANSETTVVEPNGKKIAYRFSALGLPVQYTDEAGQSTVYEYDAQKQLASVTDPLGRVTRVQYDSTGKLLSQISPLGRRVDTAYHPTLETVTQTTHYLTGSASSQGGQNLSYTPVTRSYAYDERGNMRSARTPLGRLTAFEYDAEGQLASQTAAITSGVNSVPVVADGTASSIAASARKLQFEYNAAGDRSSVTDALGQKYTIDSDGLGRASAVTDPLSNTQQQSYDAVGRPTVSTDALGQPSRIEYDSAGRLSAVVNAAGVTIESYGYDTFGRLTRITDAANRNATVEYNAANQVSAATDRKSQRTTFEYDERGRIVTISTPDRTIKRNFDAVGRVTEMSDNSSTHGWGYDNAGRITRVETTTAAGTHRLQYEYDSLDRVTKRTLSGTGIARPEETVYEWDLDNRITRHVSRFGPENALAEHQTSYVYDAAGRLSQRVGQITNVGVAEPSLAQRYHYDQVDRLSQVEYLQNAGQPSEQLLERIDYGYDARGLVISKTALNGNGSGVNDSLMSAVYGADNRMTSITLKPSADVGTHKTYNLTYDANGNLIQKVNAAEATDKSVYNWDAQNRLTGLSQSANGQTTAASFQHDLYGRRVQSSIQVAGNPAQVVQYIYDGQSLLGELRGGVLTNRLIGGLSLDENIARLAMTPGGVVDFARSRQMLTDAISSTLAQTNAQGGGVSNSYGYSPYGETNQVGPDASGNSAQYTGRENDAQGATGLYFYRARYYDPVLKRFISEDPIGLGGGSNVFAYVNGNPISLNDPTGLVYRDGNNFSDIPPPGPGCQKAIWLGGYIMGWKPCDTPPNSPPMQCKGDPPPYSPPENPTPAPTPPPPGQPPVPSPTPPGDPFDYWNCRLVTWNYFVLKQLTLGLTDLFVEGSPTSAMGEAEDKARKYGSTRGTRMAGRIIRPLSLGGDILQFTNDNKLMCEKATGYGGAW